MRLTALLLTLSAIAQNPGHNLPAASTKQSQQALPVTHVSLYKNGIGFFEHTGQITGNAAVTIDFTSAQLNDVLQSLTAIDRDGGHISGATYNSTTPLDQQLKSLPLNLSDNPSAADFYSAIRGARVEVHAPSVTIIGRLLSVEARSTPAKSGESNAAETPADRYFLTVVSDSGDVKTIELTAATSVRLLDTALHTDVSRYLQVIDANRSQSLRHLTLEDRGSGRRELHISYISEVPIWKSTYRILLTDPKTPSTSKGPQSATIQGWSVVDNTTGADWNNVQLSLIAGAPQSFIQPLSDPIYSRRPEIPIAQEAQLTPQTFDSSIEAAPQAPSVTARKFSLSNGSAGGSAGGVMGGMIGSGSGNGYGIGPGSGGNTGSGVYRVGGGLPVTVEGVDYEGLANNTLAATKTAAFDDFFAYNIAQPVTIRQNESALVPILQAKATVDRVSIVSYRNGAVSQPLRALWLTNTSGLTLDRGSFSIVENGNFAGEGLIDPVHPEEKRLLSYAADQAVHVAIEGDKTTNRIVLLRGSHGVLNIHRADVHEVTFVIHNAAAERRTVVTEVPVVPGWTLDSDPKPEETTATVYRFRTEVDPGQTVRLHVGGRRKSYTTYYLSRSDDSQFQFILKQSDDNPKLAATLQPILDARRRVADAQAAVDQSNNQLKSLHDDEDRERQNITSLATADKSSRERFVQELNKTEDAITTAQAEQAAHQATLDTAKAELSARIENFSMDEALD